MPSIKSANYVFEPYALVVLAALLSKGRSSRLFQALIREQSLFSSISAYNEPYHLYPPVLGISAVPKKNNTLSELEKGIMDELNKLITILPSTTEVNKIKRQVVAQHIFEQDSISHQEMKIGLLETIGLSWREMDCFVARIQKVTPEQVQKVAKSYLTPERLVVAKLIPQTI